MIQLHRRLAPVPVLPAGFPPPGVEAGAPGERAGGSGGGRGRVFRWWAGTGMLADFPLAGRRLRGGSILGFDEAGDANGVVGEYTNGPGIGPVLPDPAQFRIRLWLFIRSTRWPVSGWR